MLIVENISIACDGTSIITNISFSCSSGSVTLFLGKNGSGKSTLALALMGHPKYTVSGKAYLNGINLLTLPVHERSKLGLFLSFQHPQEIPGVQASTFLYESCRAHGHVYNSMDDFLFYVRPQLKLLDLDESLLYRELNHGFSGGEKKRFELLQLLLLQPRVAILDEPDSGLDVEARKVLQEVILHIKKQYPEIILIMITHYPQLVDAIIPDTVHLLNQGCIIQTGKIDMAKKIFACGYSGV